MKNSNPILVKIFLLAIILPSLLLSYLSFKSIRNEGVLLEKRYQESIQKFQSEIHYSIDRELEKVRSDVRKQSRYLFDQPRTVSDLQRAPSLKNIEGINAIFLYSQGQLRYPFLDTSSQTLEFSPPDTVEQLFIQLGLQGMWEQELKARILRRSLYTLSSRQQVLNTLGIIRASIRLGKWPLVQKEIASLRSLPDKGYLNSNLLPSLALAEFQVLSKTSSINMQVRNTLELVNHFYQNSAIYNLSSMEFTFDEIFNSLLSLELLSEGERRFLWNVRSNLFFHMQHSQLFRTHRDIFDYLRNTSTQDENGVFYFEQKNEYYFRISSQGQPSNLTILGMFNIEEIEKRILRQIQPLFREWKDIPFRLTNAQGEILAHRQDNDTLALLDQFHLFHTFPNWTLSIYPKQLSELQKESQTKTHLLYSLIAISLLFLFVGSFFMLRGISEERRMLAMKTNFISSITHELKTPLTSIRMFSEMLERGRIKKPEKVGQYSRLIQKEAQRLHEMIQSILNFSRMEQHNPQANFVELQLHDHVQMIYESLEPQALNKEQNISLHLTPSSIMGDISAIESLIRNLISNAIKYTPEHGKISVILETSPKHCIFIVEDTGIGISPTEQKRIFDDFYRVGDELTRSTQGSGLGLAIVKKVARIHRAQLQVESTPGEGSTFRVKFKQRKKDEA
jgi:signal transduction histidine kinase